MKLQGWVLLFSMLMLTSSPMYSREYRVRNSTEIDMAMAKVNPGDTLTMVNGLWSDQEIEFDASGSENNPILLRAETPGHVIITGRSRLKIEGHDLIVEGLYFLNAYMTEYKVHIIDFGSHSYRCRLTNTAMVNCNPDDWGLFYKWVRAKGTHHRIDHCYFSGKNHQDALLKIVVPDDGPSYSRIDHNYFGDIPPGKTGNGWETIRIQGPEIAAGKTIVEDNLFYHCDGEGEIISLKAGDNDLRRNTFLESIGSLTCRKNVGNRIYANFFIGNHKHGTGGIRMYSKDHVITNNYFENLNGDNEWRGALSYMTAQEGIPEVENVLAAFNTMVNCKYSVEVGVGRSSGSGRVVPPRNLTFANNLAYHPDGQVIHYREKVTGMEYEGNIMYGTPIGIAFSTGIDTVDPGLTQDANGLWRPGSNSPAINSAVGEYPGNAFDMDQQPRNDGHPDIGADELSEAPILNRPLTRADVGPEWINKPDLPVALAIRKTGGGSGTVTLDPPEGIYSKGTVVTLTAIPDTDNQFEGWKGDINRSDNPVTVVMDSNKIVNAVFTPPVTFQVSVWNVGEGEIVFDPPGGTYPQGTMVYISAEPAEGWSFSQWGGALTGNSNPDSLWMDSDKAITATFSQTMDVARNLTEPLFYRLDANYPNPFNPVTTIPFALKESGFTTLYVYDVLGHKVAELIEENLDKGYHKARFDATELASGVYFYEIRSGRFSSTKKMILMR
ncbi:T9SS type A sorting domain-containing protein [candidate division KSB1 bacterium]|nr:T9SS type A sorting domain-containing protein [candidate division KSB1 bacterium]